jgi:outer membrane protein TolC
MAMLIMVAILPIGCSTYQPRPLNTADLNRALSGFNKKEVAQQANLLNHPRISAISINFSKPLTARELSVLAVLVSPDLKALRAKEGVANAQVFDAGLLPDPKLTYTYAKTLQNIPGLVNAYSYDLFWDVASLVTTQTQLKIVKAQSLQTRYDIAWQEWLTANQAQLLASRIYFLRQQLKVAKETTGAAKRILDITKSNLLKHNTTIDEFGLRQATYLDFLDQTVTIERTLQKTILQLNQLLGIPPDKTIAINVKPIAFAPLNMNKLFEEAEVYRLDLLALQAGYLSQEATLYKAVLGQFPHFTLDIIKGRDNTNVHSIGPAIGFDIPIINRNRGTIAIAKATREQLYLEYIARLNQTRSDIATLVTELSIINKEEKILRKQLPELKKAERLMRDGVSKGNITLITYESVLTSLLTNQLRLLTLEQTTAEQMIGLQIATGKCQKGIM